MLHCPETTCSATAVVTALTLVFFVAHIVLLLMLVTVWPPHLPHVAAALLMLHFLPLYLMRQAVKEQRPLLASQAVTRPARAQALALFPLAVAGCAVAALAALLSGRATLASLRRRRRSASATVSAILAGGPTHAPDSPGHLAAQHL